MSEKLVIIPTYNEKENIEKIYLYCMRKVSNTTVAEDLTSDIIVEMLRSYT